MKQQTIRYGLIGHPLGHSFSAKYFAEKFSREGIPATYDNYDIEDISLLTSLIERQPMLKGLNVTIPYKEKVIPLLTSLTPEAQEIGAVNTISIERGEEITLTGHNTDCTGFRKSLQPLLRPHHTQALILGTGGASKAVEYVLRQLNIKAVKVSRTPREGQLSYEDITPEVMEQHLLIVNCTPLGTWPNVHTCPPLPYQAITPRHLLFDLVYNPEETTFLSRGKAQGATICNGLQMLHGQAIAAWEFWNRKEISDQKKRKK